MNNAMSWIKKFSIYIVIVFFTILFIDVISYTAYREKIQKIIPDYGYSKNDFGRGYPRYHFINDESLGFDIAKNYKTTTSTRPRHYIEYPVWGNSYGCFDNEWPKDLNQGVYLAGDSFTWGYTRYERKFGTLIEDELNVPVYACGVTHTGQRHQFEKFKRLFKRGLTPQIVIINIVSNDVSNDYFFPHTEIIKGYMIENVETCLDKEGNFKFKRIDHSTLEQELETKLSLEQPLIDFLKKYSLVGNLITKLLIPTSKGSKDSQSDTDSGCLRTVYNQKFLYLGVEYQSSDLSQANRNAIKDWISHSSTHDYDLVFSLIPSKVQKRNFNYDALEKFINLQGGKTIRFEKYIKRNNFSKMDLYHEKDAHFNELGNKKYAQFLKAYIEKNM